MNVYKKGLLDRKGKREATTNTKIHGFLLNFPISSSLARFLFAGCIELTPFSSNTIAKTNVNKKMPSVWPKGEKRAMKQKR